MTHDTDEVEQIGQGDRVMTSCGLGKVITINTHADDGLEVYVELDERSEMGRKFWFTFTEVTPIADAVCANCGGAHHIQRCPDVRAALFAA